jgi:acylphosphatase
MDLDLNIEAVVEGDDQDLEAFHDLLEMGQEHAHN